MVGMTVQTTVTTVTRSRNTTMIMSVVVVVVVVVVMSRHSMTMVTMSRRFLLWNGQTFDVS